MGSQPKALLWFHPLVTLHPASPTSLNTSYSYPISVRKRLILRLVVVDLISQITTQRERRHSQDHC